jgi:hypothetical protein
MNNVQNGRFVILHFFAIFGTEWPQSYFLMLRTGRKTRHNFKKNGALDAFFQFQAFCLASSVISVYFLLIKIPHHKIQRPTINTLSAQTIQSLHTNVLK